MPLRPMKPINHQLEHRGQIREGVPEGEQQILRSHMQSILVSQMTKIIHLNICTRHSLNIERQHSIALSLSLQSLTTYQVRRQRKASTIVMGRSRPEGIVSLCSSQLKVICHQSLRHLLLRVTRTSLFQTGLLRASTRGTGQAVRCFFSYC